jgi:hypothetical protein
MKQEQPDTKSTESLKFSHALQFDIREIRHKFNFRGTTRKRQPDKREGPSGLPSEACLSAGNMLAMFSTKANYARIRPAASTSSIKANRSQGRDAKPRAGCFQSVAWLPKGEQPRCSASDEDRGALTNWDPEGKLQAALTRAYCPREPAGLNFRFIFLYRNITGMEDFQ